MVAPVGQDPPNFAGFAAAVRAGNPDAVVGFNPGVVYRLLSITPEEDFTAGEIDDPERIITRRTDDGYVDGAQIHVLTFLGERWGTWDAPIRRDGTIAAPFLEQLRAIGAALGRS